MKRFRPRLTYSNVMATAAVFIALGGSSYAAISLSKNSVKSKHIATGQVKRSDLGKNAVDSSKVANGKLRAEDFASGELSAGGQGPAGPPGSAGAKGDKGDKGDLGTTVVARAQSTGPIATESTTDSEGGAPVPLTGNPWVQGALESNLVLLEVHYTAPDTCFSNNAGGVGFVSVKVGGRVVTGAIIGEPPVVFGATSPVSGGPGAVFEPVAPTSRTLTAFARDSCNTGQHYTINSLKIVVLGIR